MIERKRVELLTKFVKNNISKYLEFDVDEIYKVSDYAYIFGGAIRDSIVGDPINDVDIVCLPQSMINVLKVLEANGYTQEEYTKNDTNSLYLGLKVIFEPITFFKGSKKIQFIRPVSNTINETYSKFLSLLTNIDLSNCGVYYDGNLIKESYITSIEQIICKQMTKNSAATMYNPQRIDRRISKFQDRGWELTNRHDEILFGQDIYDYKPEVNSYFIVLEREENINGILEDL